VLRGSTYHPPWAPAEHPTVENNGSLQTPWVSLDPGTDSIGLRLAVCFKVVAGRN